MLNLPIQLNVDVAEAFRRSRSLGVPQSCHRPSLTEVFGPFDGAKMLQARHIQPDVVAADVRTQEGDIIWCQSTYGGDFGTVKFLQEHAHLPIHVRGEPRETMSKDNNVIAKVYFTNHYYI